MLRLRHRIRPEAVSLREINEEMLPRLARKLKLKEGDYYDLLLSFLEWHAEQAGIDPFSIRTEEEFLQEVISGWKNQN